MRLCFDATRFGSGFVESAKFAVENQIPALDFSFSRFAVSNKSAAKLRSDERKYLLQLGRFARDNNLEIASLRLSSPLDLTSKNAGKDFCAQIAKLREVGELLSSCRIIFHLLAAPNDAHADWLKKAEEAISPALAVLKEKEMKLLLSLSSPDQFLGKSLRLWRPLAPEEWRELLAMLPELSLSFSAADLVWQGIDYLSALSHLAPAIEHVEAQDIEVNREILKESGIWGPLFWRYKTVGKGQIDWGQLVEALKLYEFKGCFSMQFRDEFASENEQGLMQALESSKKLLSPLMRY